MRMSWKRSGQSQAQNHTAQMQQKCLIRLGARQQLMPYPLCMGGGNGQTMDIVDAQNADNALLWFTAFW